MADDAWRVSRKVNGLQMCLASSRVDGYVQFYFTSGEKLTDFDLDEARMLHSALGAMLPNMQNVVETAPAKSVAAPEQPAPQKEHAGKRWTDEEEDRLKTSVRAGKSISDLAKMHSRSPSAIISRLYQNELIEINLKCNYPACF